ncbi:hypothetical protein MRX96_020823 [Rhipicephalus microplus]
MQPGGLAAMGLDKFFRNHAFLHYRTSALPSSLTPSPPSILLIVVLACLPRNNNTAIKKGTHVSSVPLSWRHSGLLLQASGRCLTSSWTRLLRVKNSFEDRFDPVTPSVSSGNTRLSAASSCRSYLLQCLSVGLTLAPEKIADDPVHQSNLTRQQFCSLQVQVDNRSAPSIAVPNPFTGDTRHRQYREVFCVFDTKYYRTAGAVYLPRHMPFDFCSSLIYSSVAILYDRIQWRRPDMDETFLSHFLGPVDARPIMHRKHALHVYITLGGEPEDGANFTKAFRDDERLFRFTHNVAEFLVDYGFAGLHVDWDHPNGVCGDRSDKANLLRFAQMLRSQRPERLLLLSVLPEKMQHYGLEQLLPLLTYVVVTTHRANRYLSSSLVQCSARGSYVARVMFNVRKRFPDMWQYFIYSVSVGLKVDPVWCGFVGIPTQTGVFRWNMF